MRGSEEHQDWGIGQGFLRSREIHVVARDVGARFGGVPRETQGKKSAPGRWISQSGNQAPESPPSRRLPHEVTGEGGGGKGFEFRAVGEERRELSGPGFAVVGGERRLGFLAEERDGFGAPGTGALACAPPSRSADNDLDCDDGDALRVIRHVLKVV